MRQRMCVNCETDFLSTGPGNVVCSDCKTSLSGESWGPKKDADTELLEFAEHLRLENARLQLIRNGEVVDEYEYVGPVTMTIERISK